MAVTPLTVCCGDAAALICCQEPALYKTLAYHLRHCAHRLIAPAVVYAVKPGSGSLQLYRDDTLLYHGPSASYVLERLLHDLTLTLVRHCRQHLVFHAAGLAWGERGLLLCGESGSGKSTLAAHLVANGFDYLTDELVALSPEGIISGLARPIVLKAGSKSIWQRWLDMPYRHSPVHFDNGSTLLDPALLGAGRVRGFASPHLLLFPRYTAGRPFQVQPLSSATAAFHLLHRLLNADSLASQGFADAVQLARQTAAYSLVYGDASAAVAWMSQLLSD